MSDDIVARLRALGHRQHDDLDIGFEAADEIERLRSLTDWRPIESAPKDGTRILADCGAEYQPPYAVRVIFWYDALQWEGEYGPDSGWVKDLPDDTTDAEFTEREPTVWLPLPEPPKG